MAARLDEVEEIAHRPRVRELLRKAQQRCIEETATPAQLMDRRPNPEVILAQTL